MKNLFSRFTVTSVGLSTVCLYLLLVPLKSGAFTPQNTSAQNATLASLKIASEASPADGTIFRYTLSYTATALYRNSLGTSGSNPGQLEDVYDVAVDQDGNTYVSDLSLHRIQKFDATGQFITTWGEEGSGDGQFVAPKGLAIDADANIYVVDSGNHRIQKFNSGGSYLTQWGTQGNGDGQLDGPVGVAVDANGNLLVADTGNHRIQRFDAVGTYLGQWGSNGDGDGQFSYPSGLATGPDGNIYVADTGLSTDTGNHRIQKFSLDGIYITQWGGKGTAAGQLNQPLDIAIDKAGYVYVTSQELDFVTKYDLTGTYLGRWDGSERADGAEDLSHDQDSTNGGTPGEDGSLAEVRGLGIDALGNIYVADPGYNRIQVYAPNRLASKSIAPFTPGESWTLEELLPGVYTVTQSLPTDWTLDDVLCNNGASVTLLEETPANPIAAKASARIDINSNLTTCTFHSQRNLGSIRLTVQTDAATSPPVDFTLESPRQNVPLYQHRLSWGTQGGQPSQFENPQDMLLDNDGNLYVTDDKRVQKFDTDGTYQTHWGVGGIGESQLRHPRGIALDSDESLYIADRHHNAIFKFAVDSTTAVSMTALQPGDDPLQYTVTSVEVDSNGIIYLLDEGANRVQKLDASGQFLSQWTIDVPGDEIGVRATNLLLGADGNIYISDNTNHAVYKFDIDGNWLATIGSFGTEPGKFHHPENVDLDALGNLYVADEGNHRIQKLSPDGQPLAMWGTFGLDAGQLRWPNGVVLSPGGDVYVTEALDARVHLFEPRSAIQQISSVSAGQIRLLPELRPGTYTLTQTLPSGWFLHDANCNAGVTTAPVENGLSIELSSQNTSCTFIIDDEPAATTTPTVTPSGTLQGIDGLYREAEEGEIPAGSVLEILPDVDASGGLYVSAPLSVTDAGGLVENNRIDYTFNITQPGTYKLNALILANPSQDSFYVKVDGAPDSGITWYLTHSSEYKYDEVNAHEVGDPYTFNLSSGLRTISFYHRDSGARLDTIELVLVAPDPTTPTPTLTPTLTPTPNSTPILTPTLTPTLAPTPNFPTLSVVGEDGLPVAGAHVFAAGQALGETDLNGQLDTSIPAADAPLVALAQQAEFGTAREFHDGWAYRAYQTNIRIEQDGTPSLYTSTGARMQTLSISRTNALILFNLVVSVEWDATDDYLGDLVDAIQKAADLLYDATDGQMSFEQVTIYDNAQGWQNADIQISAKNVVHPHAYVGGLTDEDSSHLIRVGRAWDGISGARGNWSNDEGYQTLVHEFGHYALGLYDEYFGYREIDGQLAGRTEAFCTSPESRGSDPDSSNASIMDYHYVASELADNGRWTEWCQKTAQHLLNNGQSDWETVKQNFSDMLEDELAAPRWMLISPDERAGVGNAVPGPFALPDALPFPRISIENVGADPTPFAAQVCYNNVPYQDGAWVTLTKSNGLTMDQGLTSDLAGQLDILGASNGDRINVVSVNGVLAGSELVEDIQRTGTLSLESIASQAQKRGKSDFVGAASGLAEELPPFVRLWPTTSGGSIDGIRMVIERTTPDDDLDYALTGPDDIGPTAAIAYDDAENNHNVQIGFVPASNTGFARAKGLHDGQPIRLNVDFRQQTASRVQESDLFSNDGNLMLHLEQDAFSSDNLAFLIASPWGLPGPAPSGKTIIGEIYDITAAENVTALNLPSVLRIRYDSQGVEGSSVISPTIARWDLAHAQWLEIESQQNLERQEVIASITGLGIYALMGQALEVDATSGSQRHSSPNACSTVEAPDIEVVPSVYLPAFTSRQ